MQKFILFFTKKNRTVYFVNKACFLSRQRKNKLKNGFGDDHD